MGEDGPAEVLDETVEPSTGSVAVRVQLVGLPGAPPAADTPVPALPLIGPAEGALVQAVDPTSPDVIVAEAVADEAGEVHFEVPAGVYWVLVPWSDHAPGPLGATIVGGNLPDGRPVLTWGEATVPDGETVEVILTITIALV